MKTNSLVTNEVRRSFQEKVGSKSSNASAKTRNAVVVKKNDRKGQQEDSVQIGSARTENDDFDQVVKLQSMGRKFQLQNSSKGSKVSLQASGTALTAETKNAPPAGSLIMNDRFGKSQGMTHGMIGTTAARHHGFQGTVIENHTDGPGASAIKLQASTDLVRGQLNGAQARKALTQVLEQDAVGMYDQQIPLLKKMTAAGTKNSAANISWGSSKAEATGALYGLAASAWEGGSPEARKQGQTTLGNLARAFKLDNTKLMSSDPKVHAAERQKLQQSLANFSSDVIDNSPVVAKAKSRFNDAVVDFEAGNNSVVISSGNSGRVLDELAAKNHGLTIKTSPDFFKSVLDSEHVTSVGATRWFSNKGKLEERLAQYSSQYQGVDIHASGSVGLKDPNKADEYGTSFAAPRVAATMARLHKDNPDLSSAQVENLLRESMTHKLSGQGGQELNVLDFKKAYELLQRRAR